MLIWYPPVSFVPNSGFGMLTFCIRSLLFAITPRSKLAGGVARQSKTCQRITHPGDGDGTRPYRRGGQKAHFPSLPPLLCLSSRQENVDCGAAGRCGSLLQSQVAALQTARQTKPPVADASLPRARHDAS